MSIWASLLKWLMGVAARLKFSWPLALGLKILASIVITIFTVAIVLVVTTIAAPDRVKDGGCCAPRLDRMRVDWLVVTVLPLSSMRESAVSVVVNLAPSLICRRFPPIV